MPLRTKAAPVVEPPEETPAPSESATVEDVARMISEAISGLVAGAPSVEEEPAKEELPVKPTTVRGEEEAMFAKISGLIHELEGKEKASGEKHEDKGEEAKPVEKAPGSPEKRRIERFMGWS